MDMFEQFDHYATPIGPDGTPYAYYEELRDWAAARGRPLGWSKNHDGFWVVVGYDAIKEVLGQPETFSASILTIPPYNLPGGRPLMVAEYDEPDHSKYRNLVAGSFSPKGVSQLADKMRETTNDLINQFIGEGSVDAAEEIAKQLPARAISLIMGLPAGEGDVYHTWTLAMTHMALTDPEASAKHLQDMNDYFQRVIVERRDNPGDDVLSAMALADVDGSPLSEEELLDFCFIFLIGGLDNTSKLIADLLWRLAWDHELRRRLVAHPELIPSAVDEALRFYSPAPTVRTALKTTEVAGIEIKEGERLLLALQIANRDPRQFDHPDTFIVDRAPNRHIALSSGIHRCLGAHLLRLEAKIAVEEFLLRIPEFSLDPARDSEWLVGQVGGMISVPIVFPSGAAEAVVGARQETA